MKCVLTMCTGFDIDEMKRLNPRFNFRRYGKTVHIRAKCVCPDCGSAMADGGACGYYCTAKGCDHDTIKGAKR